MARYNKIRLGPVQKNCPQVQEAIMDADTAPGSIVTIDPADGEFIVAATEGGSLTERYYVLNHNFVGGGQIDDDVPAGDTGIGEPLMEEFLIAALLLGGQNITAIDTPLTISATPGVLKIAGPAEFPLFYSKEVYNNDTGEPQLVRVRPAP